MSNLLLIVVLVVSTGLGYRVISEVPSLLHTPLMSGMNALSGITVVGALVAAAASVSVSSRLLGFVAIVFATINVVAGFLVTHRMLKMFKSGGEGQ